MADHLFSGYRNLWRETPGAMTLAHYCIIAFVAIFVLMYVRPLWGLGALLFWLLSTAGLMQVCVAWDLGR